VKTYVIACLLDIRSVVQSKEAQPFDRLIEMGVDDVTDLFVDGGVVDRHMAKSSTWRRKRTDPPGWC
jgi:hypothetical protein